MAVAIDWMTRVITIPRADLIPLGGDRYQLDLDWFRQQLNALQASSEGMTHPSTHNHIPPIGVGGLTLARVVEIVNGYTVTFEDGMYAVKVVGGNSNISDAQNINGVSLQTQNSAGLVQVAGDGSSGGATLAPAIAADITAILSLLRGNPEVVQACEDGATGRHIVRDRSTGETLIDKTITKAGDTFTWADTDGNAGAEGGETTGDEPLFDEAMTQEILNRLDTVIERMDTMIAADSPDVVTEDEAALAASGEAIELDTSSFKQTFSASWQVNSGTVGAGESLTLVVEGRTSASAPYSRIQAKDPIVIDENTGFPFSVMGSWSMHQVRLVVSAISGTPTVNAEGRATIGGGAQ